MLLGKICILIDSGVRAKVGNDMAEIILQEEDTKSFESLDEMVFIIDAYSYELMFLNKAARKAYGVDEYHGETCYKILQRRNKPCDHCSKMSNKFSRLKTWQYYNPILKRYVEISDKLVNYCGRPSRLQVGVDITKQEKQRLALKNALDAERAVNSAVQILYSSRNFSAALEQVMNTIGLLLHADRMYYCSIDEWELSGIREWCNIGVKSRSIYGSFLASNTLQSWKPSFKARYVLI